MGSLEHTWSQRGKEGEIVGPWGNIKRGKKELRVQRRVSKGKRELEREREREREKEGGGGERWRETKA